MKVIGWSSGPEPWQNFPFPKENGIIFSLRGGDVVFPWDGNWFTEPFFKHVLHFYMPIPILPFFCIKIGSWGLYAGFKAFGVDSPAYKNWLPPEEVYDGSVAIQPSIRMSLALWQPLFQIWIKHNLFTRAKLSPLNATNAKLNQSMASMDFGGANPTMKRSSGKLNHGKLRPQPKFHRTRTDEGMVPGAGFIPVRCVRIHMGLKLRHLINTSTILSPLHSKCSHMHCKVFDLWGQELNTEEE